MIDEAVLLLVSISFLAIMTHVFVSTGLILAHSGRPRMTYVNSGLCLDSYRRGLTS